MAPLGKLERPFGILLMGKDDLMERVLYSFPYQIEVPNPVAEKRKEKLRARRRNRSKWTAPPASVRRDAENDEEDDEASGTEDEEGDRTPNVAPQSDEAPLKSLRNVVFTWPVEEEEPAPMDETGRVPVELPLKQFATLLQPKENVIGTPYEIKVDNISYCGVPCAITKGGQCLMVIFVLPGHCPTETINNIEAAAIHVEQQRCGYFHDQLQKMQPFLDREDSCSITSGEIGMKYCPFADIEKESSLAATLRQAFEDVSRYSVCDVFVNDCIHVGFCMERRSLCATTYLSNEIAGDAEKLSAGLRPYHTILFNEDIVPGPDANPHIHRFFDHYAIDKSLQQIGAAAGIPSEQLHQIVVHYLLWSKARIIFPIKASNVYSTTETVVPSKSACDSFFKQFGASLITLVSGFYPPRSLRSFLTDEHHRRRHLATADFRLQMLVFMLRNEYLTQLHSYYYLLPPDPMDSRFQRSVTTDEERLLSARIKTQIANIFNTEPEIRDALLRIAVDALTVGVPLDNADIFESDALARHHLAERKKAVRQNGCLIPDGTAELTNGIQSYNTNGVINLNGFVSQPEKNERKSSSATTKSSFTSAPSCSTPTPSGDATYISPTPSASDSAPSTPRADSPPVPVAESEFFTLLSVFVACRHLFDGQHHADAIMHSRGVSRDALLQALHLFSPVLQSFVGQDTVGERSAEYADGKRSRPASASPEDSPPHHNASGDSIHVQRRSSNSPQ